MLRGRSRAKRHHVELAVKTDEEQNASNVAAGERELSKTGPRVSEI